MMHDLVLFFASPIFASPWWFLSGIILPLLVLWYIKRHKKQEAFIKFSKTNFSIANKSLKTRLIHLPFILSMLAMAFIIMAMARPQFRISKENLDVEGIDIMMAVDISGSMLAEDFKPNRIEAAKELGINFIKERPTDCIGLVIYAGEAFTQCPITIDHNVLTQLFEEVSSGDLKDGTAIGDGLATAVDRLRYSNAVSKVVILLTDGVNNSGFIDPLTAAEIAKIYGIRVYTIGVGTKGKAPYPFQSPFGTDYQYVEVEINEDLLNEIANMTGGKYFRATDNKSLEAIYEEIDKLEKSKINITTFTNNKDIFSYFLYIAFVLLGIQFLLKYTYLKSVS